MILNVFSDDIRFKTLSFRPGLNVLLADRSSRSNDLQTRNRAGKTSLIEIVHFLTGADADPKSMFRHPTMMEHSFGMSLALAGTTLQIGRSGSNPSKVSVVELDPSSLSHNVARQSTDTDFLLSNTAWRTRLGKLMFDLDDSDRSDQEGRFSPTFRMLFAYFVRRQSSQAFASPFQQSSMQRLWDQQVAVSFLLGLDWTISQQWQGVRKKESEIKELRKAATDGALGSIIGTVAELRTRLAVFGERTRRLRVDINAFRVLPQYREYESEASSIARELGLLADGNSVDLRVIRELELSVDGESQPELIDIEGLYSSVGITLPDHVLRQYDEVVTFHRSVTHNRRLYLEGEIASARQRVSERQVKMGDLSRREAEIMLLLQSSGALEQFGELQSELARLDAEAESTRQKFEVAERIEGTRTQLDLERSQLLLRLQQDHREQEDSLEHAIVTFQEISGSLYEEAGALTVSESANGPKYEVQIHGSRSKGITNMQIYCFDMMLMRLCSEKEIGPRFLVHDSHLFDGVDERQIAKALEVGARTAQDYGFQYIVTLNSDDLPSPGMFTQLFDIDSHVLTTRLTDLEEEGGLFGFRFS